MIPAIQAKTKYPSGSTTSYTERQIGPYPRGHVVCVTSQGNLGLRRANFPLRKVREKAQTLAAKRSSQ